MASPIHVSISAETIANIGPLAVTNSMFTGVITSALIIAFALYFNTLQLKKKNPSKVQNIVEIFVESLFNLCKDVAGTKKARDFFPLIASFFLFIMLTFK